MELSRGPGHHSGIVKPRDKPGSRVQGNTELAGTSLFPELYQAVLGTSSLESAREVVLETLALTPMGVACFHICWHTSKGQRSASVAIPQEPVTLSSEAGSFSHWELELTD